MARKSSLKSTPTWTRHNACTSNCDDLKVASISVTLLRGGKIMQEIRHGCILVSSIGFMAIVIAVGCESPPTNSAVGNANSAPRANSITNTNTNSNSVGSTSTVTTSEPEQYQANIKMTLETLGGTQKAALP